VISSSLRWENIMVIGLVDQNVFQKKVLMGDVQLQRKDDSIWRSVIISVSKIT